MKLIFSFFLLVFAFTSANAQGYKVTLKAPQYKGGLAYLTYYYGKNMNVQDSAMMNAKGVAVFEGKDKILPGVYSVVLPGKSKLFDFLIAKKQIIDVSIPDTTDIINTAVVTGAEENDLFQKYQKYASEKGKSLQKEIEAYKTATTKEDSAAHEKKYKAVNVELYTYLFYFFLFTSAKINDVVARFYKLLTNFLE